jgi:hypothetical protein
MSEVKFINGLFVNEPHEKAPDFVKCKISIKRDQFIPWLENQEVTDKGYVYITVNQSKAGKLYAQIDSYKKQQTEQTNEQTTDATTGIGNDLPF